MSYYVFSTMTGGVDYCIHIKPPVGTGGVNRVVKKVTIKGGANLADKQLVTPQGVVTQISDEDYEILKENLVFRKHVAAGFVKVEKVKQPVEKAVKSLEAKDKSAPTTPADYKTTEQGMLSSKSGVVPGVL